MKKQRIIFTILYILLTLIIPNNVEAKDTIANENITIKKAVDTTAISRIRIYDDQKYFIPDNQELTTSVVGAFVAAKQANVNGWLDGYQQTQNCGESGLLGNVNDPDSVAWLLQKILNYIKVLGPFIVVVMSSIDFAKVIITSDDDDMKKAQKKLITRLLLAASLFFLPQLVVVLLNIFGITSNATCGIG